MLQIVFSESPEISSSLQWSITSTKQAWPQQLQDLTTSMHQHRMNTPFQWAFDVPVHLCYNTSSVHTHNHRQTVQCPYQRSHHISANSSMPISVITPYLMCHFQVPSKNAGNKKKATPHHAGRFLPQLDALSSIRRTNFASFIPIRPLSSHHFKYPFFSSLHWLITVTYSVSNFVWMPMGECRNSPQCREILQQLG